MNDNQSSNFIPLRKQLPYPIGLHTHKVDATCAINADQIRSKFGIEVEGNSVPSPIEHFQDMGIPIKYLNFLRKSKNMEKPTPIQMQAISCLIKGRDIISLSATGSGKTYAYLLPMTLLLDECRGSVGINSAAPICLIIVPTRELMNQVYKNVTELLAIGKFEGSSSYHFGVLNAQTRNYYPIDNNSLHHPYAGYSFEKIEKGNLNDSNMIDTQSCSIQGNNSHFQRFDTPRNKEPMFDKDNSIIGICGGVPVKEDIAKLNSSTKVVVATPGRLIDLCDRSKLSLSRIKYFVVDECDKLLEMGLEEQLRTIVAMITVHGRPVQTSLWSATLPESLERIARSAVIDPIYICTGVKDTVTSNIEQNILFLHSYMKDKLLLDVIRKTPYPPIIVFVHSKRKADELAEMLQNEQFHVAAIHSDKEQSYRNQVMSSFKGDELDILVATDLISRGIDIPAVTHVINFDTPDTIEDYLHRCGRTGRFGRSGLATTFLTLDCKIAKELKEMLISTKSEVPRELLDTSQFGKSVLKTEMGDRVIN